MSDVVLYGTSESDLRIPASTSRRSIFVSGFFFGDGSCDPPAEFPPAPPPVNPSACKRDAVWFHRNQLGIADI